jgi:hypothetical protein
LALVVLVEPAEGPQQTGPTRFSQQLPLLGVVSEATVIQETVGLAGLVEERPRLLEQRVALVIHHLQARPRVITEETQTVVHHFLRLVAVAVRVRLVRMVGQTLVTEVQGHHLASQAHR